MPWCRLDPETQQHEPTLQLEIEAKLKRTFAVNPAYFRATYSKFELQKQLAEAIARVRRSLLRSAKDVARAEGPQSIAVPSVSAARAAAV